MAQCLTDLFGIFSVQLPMVDESGAPADGGVRIVALHEGTDSEQVQEVKRSGSPSVTKTGLPTKPT